MWNSYHLVSVHIQIYQSVFLLEMDGVSDTKQPRVRCWMETQGHVYCKYNLCGILDKKKENLGRQWVPLAKC